MGLDDAIAILMLLSCRNIEITGISTVNGVSRAKKGAENLNGILNYLNFSIPVLAGSNRSLVKTATSFPAIDRKRSEQFWNKYSLANKNIEILIEDFIFNNFKEKQTLVTLGPLTNIAKAIKKYGDRFTRKIDEIYLMGGGIKYGNVPEKLVEYNILLDPEAADIVFRSEIPIIMIGIDATRRAPATKKLKQSIGTITSKSQLSKLIKQVISYNDNDFNYFYDPLLSAILLDSSLITLKTKCFITVDKTGKNRGRTIATINNQGNVQAILEVDSYKFNRNLTQIVKM